MRAAIYLRMSKERQGAVSLDVQLADCESFAERMGWAVIGVWQDLLSGSNARSAQRPQYRAMLDAAASWDTLLTWKLDRIGRQELEFHRMLADLDAKGKAFAAATEDMADPLMRSIRVAFAAEEARRIGKRTGSAKAKKAEQGFWPTKPPFGTRCVGGLLEPDERFPLVEEAFRRVANGEPLARVAEWLNRGPLAAAPRNLTGIRRWFANPAYTGRVVWKGVDAAARWPPLIDPTVAARAEARLRDRAHHRPRDKSSWVAAFWSAGLAVCGDCGAPCSITVTENAFHTRYGYYYCARYNKGERRRGCSRRGYSALVVERRVLAQLRARFAALAGDPAALRAELTALAAGQGGDGGRAGLLAAVDTARTRRDRADEGYLAGVFSAERARALKGDADARIATLEAEIAAIAAPTPLDVEAIVTVLSTPAWLDLAGVDPPLFRSLLQALVRHIELRPSDVLVADPPLRGWAPREVDCRIIWTWDES